MCGRIISLCKQLVPKPKRTRGAWQPDGTLHEPVELGARAKVPQPNGLVGAAIGSVAILHRRLGEIYFFALVQALVATVQAFARAST